MNVNYYITDAEGYLLSQGRAAEQHVDRMISREVDTDLIDPSWIITKGDKPDSVLPRPVTESAESVDNRRKLKLKIKADAILASEDGVQKQINLLARYVSLLEIKVDGGTLTSAQENQMTAIKTRFARIRQIIAALEAAENDGTTQPEDFTP